MAYCIHCTQELLARIKPPTIAPHNASSTGQGNGYATLLFWKPQVALRGNEKTLLTLEKIPKRVFTQCEWGRDNYRLNVAKLPMAQQEPETAPAAKAGKSIGAKQQAAPQPGLFGEEGA